MSWIDEIKTIYYFTIALFFIILWGLINIIISLDNYVNYKFFILMIISIIAYVFIKKYISNRKIMFFILMIFDFLLVYLVFMYENILLNYLGINIFNYFIYKVDLETIEYSLIKERLKKSLALIIFLSLLGIVLNLEAMECLFKYYIFYLIFSIILIREVRNFNFGLKNRKSFIGNILISIFICLLSIDYIYVSIGKLVKLLVKSLDSFFTQCLMVIGTGFAHIFSIINVQPKTNRNNQPRINHSKSMNVIMKKSNFIEKNKYTVPLWISKLIIYIIIGILIYFILKHMLNIFKVDEKCDSLVIEEKREKIYKYDNEKYGKKYKNIILKNFSPKINILNIYGKFQKLTYKKGWFKKYMTASQLKNNAKLKINNNDNNEQLDALTDIYNEAKFSKHNIDKKKEVQMKKNYEKIKKEIK